MKERIFAATWIAKKVTDAALAHKKLYPTFNADRVLDKIASMDAKSQAWAAFQPMQRHAASQHGSQAIRRYEKKERAKRNDSDLQMIRDRDSE